MYGRVFPAWLRAFVRARETGLALVALFIGAASGLAVTGMSVVSQLLHEALFHIPHGVRLSVSTPQPGWRVVAVVAAGGALLALLGLWAGARFKGRMADAIEANALHGGRMSLGGSFYITAQTMISNGFGASVGLEAAYTQICAALSSLLGRALGARRIDMRLLVACGAAGAIAAAFNAPLAGAFYGFEVVLGAYSVASLVPIAASAVVSSVIAGRFVDHRLLAGLPDPQPPGPAMFLHIAVVGLICALASIALMSAVGRCERLFGLLKPAWLRPVLGGAVVGALGVASAQSLASGHGAIGIATSAGFATSLLVSIAILKAAAAAVSLGSGFRGGLFFASLFLGALVGRCYADAVSLVAIAPPADAATMAVVGMAAFGTGIVGAPVAMTCLALEMTGDFGVTLGALVVSAIVSLVVRETFGYSFATWRFHLRGETIRGPHDVGWARDLTVGRLMRRDVQVLPADATIAQARKLVTPGSAKEAMLVDGDQRYCGAVLVSELHAATEAPEAPVATLAQWPDTYLTADLSARRALDLFAESEADVLAVVSDPVSRRVIGRLSEAHALRRYGEELERRNREFAR